MVRPPDPLPTAAVCRESTELLLTQNLCCTVWWHVRPACSLCSGFLCRVCVLEEVYGRNALHPHLWVSPRPTQAEHRARCPSRGREPALPLPFTLRSATPALPISTSRIRPTGSLREENDTHGALAVCQASLSPADPLF